MGLLPEWNWKLLGHVRLFAVHGILQARILEWVAFPFSRGSSQPRDWNQVSHIAGGFFISWATREAQEYWNGYPIPSPVDLPDPGIELRSPALQADSLPTELSGKSPKSKYSIQLSSVAQSCLTLCSPWNSPGQNTGLGSLSLLQRIFPTQGSNLGLPHCRQILYQLSNQGSLKILEWVAYTFSRGSSWTRNQTRVSCIAGGFFTNWATREAHKKPINICFSPS